ncbi:MAG: hypothetical protein WCS70_08200 [Verrucomicrobiota bacterium]
MNINRTFLVLVVGMRVYVSACGDVIAECTKESLKERWRPLSVVHPADPMQARVLSAREMIAAIDSSCVPTLVQLLDSSEEPAGVKCGAAYTLGIIGIINDVSTAVPSLIKLIQSYEGKDLGPTEISLVYYAHIALGEIGTREAREFLFARAKSDYWKTHAGYVSRTLGPEKLPGSIYSRGTAIQAIPFLVAVDSETFLKELLNEPDFRNQTDFHGADAREGDLGRSVNLALKAIERERQFVNYLQTGNPVPDVILPVQVHKRVAPIAPPVPKVQPGGSITPQ